MSPYGVTIPQWVKGGWSPIITQGGVTWYWAQHDYGSGWYLGLTCKERHPISPPLGWALGCLLWVFVENWPYDNNTRLEKIWKKRITVSSHLTSVDRTHNSHPISCPQGQARGHLVWVLWRKFTTWMTPICITFGIEKEDLSPYSVSVAQPWSPLYTVPMVSSAMVVLVPGINRGVTSKPGGAKPQLGVSAFTLGIGPTLGLSPCRCCIKPIRISSGWHKSPLILLDA